MRDRVGRYEIKRNIAHGGMASVYLAHDPLVDRDVALKVLPHVHLQDPAFRVRFEREGRIIADLEHPSIVPVYDYGESDDLLYIVMRHMGGGSLGERMADGPLILAETIEILKRIGRALDSVHERGVIHRDIKPSNILFDRHGEAFLADFGIAKIAEATAMYTGSSLIGTPAYMSPEQFHSNSGVGPLSDIYSLGAILFEMVAGQQPFPADSPAAYMMGHLMGDVPTVTSLVPELPSDLDAVVTRCLAKAPEDRYQSLAELVEDLESVERGETPRAVRETALLPPPAERATEQEEEQEAGAAAMLLSRLSQVPRWAYGATGVALLLVFLLTSLATGRPWGIASAADGGTLQIVTVVATPTGAPATAGALPVALAPSTPTATVTPTATPSRATATLAPTRFPSVQIVVPFLSLFAGPAYTYEIVTTVTQGDVLALIGRTDDSSWYNVAMEDGTEGWIPAGGAAAVDDDMLEIVPTSVTGPTPTTAGATATSTPASNPNPNPTSPPPAPTSPPPPAPTATEGSVFATPSPVPTQSEPTLTPTKSSEIDPTKNP